MPVYKDAKMQIACNQCVKLCGTIEKSNFENVFRNMEWQQRAIVTIL